MDITEKTDDTSVQLEIKKIRENASLPFYANPGDAGMDIVAAEDLLLQPEESGLVATGLILNIPIGYEVEIRPRSGLSLKTRIRLPNAPGTIDSGFKDELMILVYNASPHSSSYGTDAKIRQLDLNETDNRAGAYLIKVGDRVCQMLLKKVEHANTMFVEEFSADNGIDRGGGFGSSGVSLKEDL